MRWTCVLIRWKSSAVQIEERRRRPCESSELNGHRRLWKFCCIRVVRLKIMQYLTGSHVSTPSRPITVGQNNTNERFWATVCKTVRPMLSVRCLSVLSVCPVCQSVCLSVCDVRALWPNGWTDQDETWNAGTPRPWPLCVRWGPSSSSPMGAEPPPQFSAHICCSQMAVWIKMPLSMEVGLSPGDFVLDRDPALPSPKMGAEPPPQFSAHFYCGQWLQYRCMHQDATWYEGSLSPGDFVLDGSPAP